MINLKPINGFKNNCVLPEIKINLKKLFKKLKLNLIQNTKSKNKSK